MELLSEPKAAVWTHVHIHRNVQLQEHTHEARKSCWRSRDSVHTCAIQTQTRDYSQVMLVFNMLTDAIYEMMTSLLNLQTPFKLNFLKIYYMHDFIYDLPLMCRAILWSKFKSLKVNMIFSAFYPYTKKNCIQSAIKHTAGYITRTCKWSCKNMIILLRPAGCII